MIKIIAPRKYDIAYHDDMRDSSIFKSEIEKCTKITLEGWMVQLHYPEDSEIGSMYPNGVFKAKVREWPAHLSSAAAENISKAFQSLENKLRRRYMIYARLLGTLNLVIQIVDKATQETFTHNLNYESADRASEKLNWVNARISKYLNGIDDDLELYL